LESFQPENSNNDEFASMWLNIQRKKQPVKKQEDGSAMKSQGVEGPEYRGGSRLD
jgi:hypothetical protein